MPNWCEGTMKVRGSRKNVEHFLMNCLNKYEFNPKKGESEIMPKSMAVTKLTNEYGTEYDICDSVYIEGTDRAFVDSTSIYFDSDEEDVKGIIVVLPFRQAWSIKAEDFDKLKDEWDVDFRVYGVDCGMGFDMEVVAVRGEPLEVSGVDYGSYGDFLWECPFPNMGG